MENRYGSDLYCQQTTEPAPYSALMSSTFAPDRAVLGEHDYFLFNEGSHYRLYEKLGSHPCSREGQAGTQFAVWAPGAHDVYVFGDFNGWDKGATRLYPQGASGIWVGFVPGVGPGAAYKYHIHGRDNGYRVDKADPFAVFSEVPPKTASVVCDLAYEWGDAEWMTHRHRHNGLRDPISIYEVHLGSRMRGDGDPRLS